MSITKHKREEIMAAKIVQIDHKTWRIEDDFVYYYLLEGDERALLIDSGLTESDAAKVVSSLTDLPVTLVNTHGDGDHTAGNGDFEGFYIHPEDYLKRQLDQRFPDTRHYDLSDGDCFELGNRLLKVIEIPGHTYGSIALLDIHNRVLYAGDTVQDSIIYLFGAHRCPAKFSASLERLIELEESYDMIYASHGTAVLPKEYARLVLEDWNAVSDHKIEGTDEELFGNPVRTFRAKHCGFYCDRT